jgi:DNA-binding ferritin-like protein
VLELIREGFIWDLLVVIALTVLLGASVAGGVAYAVNAYLARQVTGVLGDLGEYDLILHVREESCDAAKAEIQKTISSGFKGAHVKEGPVVLGKSNFFVALPDRLRNRSGLESLAKLLGEVPGASGVTFIIEPRLTLTGVESGAFYLILNQAEKIRGVRFCFRDGGRIAVVLESEADVRQVSDALTSLLESYQVIEVRFPIGHEMEDAEASGEAYTEKLISAAGSGFARDITRRGGNSELADLSVTLAEMKRFLRHYAAYADISITGDTPLKAGDTVLLRANRTQDMLVLIEQVKGNTARGIVTQGDTDLASDAKQVVFSVDSDNEAKDLIGTATVISESKKIGYAVDESIRLLDELEKFRGNAYQAAVNAMDILGMYDEAVGNLVSVQRALEGAMESLGKSPDGTIGWREAAAVEKALNDAMSIVDSLESAVREMDTFEAQAKQVAALLSSKGDEFQGEAESYGEMSPEIQEKMYMLRYVLDLVGIRTLERAKAIDEFAEDVGPITSQLATWKSTLENLFQRVSGIRAVLATGQAGQVVSEMMDVTNNVLVRVQAMDIPGLEDVVSEAAKNLEAVEAINTKAIIAELQQVKASLPDLRDDEVGRSIRLIDRYIGGEVIPGDCLKILVDAKTDRSKSRVFAKEMFGKDVRVYVSPAGLLEPGVRSEVFRVLQEARASVAAIVSVIVTFLALILDHAAIVSAIREFEKSSKRKFPSWSLVAGSSTVYLMTVGVVILVPQFALTGAKLPYVNFGHIAVVGALIGFAVATQCNKISPAPTDEIVAGVAMGLTHTQIMREIVVPSSRPGLLSLMNRSKTVFRQKGGGSRVGKLISENATLNNPGS